MVDKKKLNSTVATLEAAGSFTRRVLLKGAVAAGAAAAVGPWYVSNALSSSGELSLLNWDDELPDPVIPDFEKRQASRLRQRRSRRTKSRSTSSRLLVAMASIFASRRMTVRRNSRISPFFSHSMKRS